MLKDRKDTKRESGFTLIELSIVLVIIGLIIGGVLVGQDLIRAAEIRATISQIEKYNTAVNTFRGKYNGIPGDLMYTSASAFGIIPAGALPITGGGNAGLGDGNGLIEGGASNAANFIGEPVMFWAELSQAGYMDGSFGIAMTTSAAMAADATSTALANNYMPPAKMGRGNSVNVASNSGTNFFIIGSFGGGTITASSGAYAGSATDSMTPQEAYNIDRKVDDGIPGTGSVQAMTLTVALTYTTLGNAGTAASGGPVANCASTTAYTLSGTLGASPNCAIRMRFN